MNRFLKKSVLLLLATASFLTSCKKDDDNNQYVGENKVTISATKISLTPATDGTEKTSVTINLLREVTENTTLKIELTGENAEKLIDIPAEVTIAKGQKSVSFEVKIKENVVISANSEVFINIAEHKDVKKGENLRLTLVADKKVSQMTPEQIKLLESYIKNKNLNLLGFLGEVEVTGKVFSSKGGNLKEFSKSFVKDIEGKSIIEISENADETTPVLNFSKNPLGVEEFLYWVFRKETIENDEFWYDDYTGPDIKQSMQMLNWNKTSVETFSMSLDGVKIGKVEGGVAKLSFVEEVEVKGDNKNIVPFKFKYSAWDRLQKLVESGDADAERISMADGTSNPAYYINNADVLEDEYSNGAFVTTQGKIDFNTGEMSFTFLVGHENGGDYLKFVVTYKKKN